MINLNNPISVSEADPARSQEDEEWNEGSATAMHVQPRPHVETENEVPGRSEEIHGSPVRKEILEA